MEHQVTGCIDCPFNSNDREYGDCCLHPSVAPDEHGAALPEDENYKTITPKWCPLAIEPITISRLKQ